MPPFGETAQERQKWFKFQKQKWQFQRKQRQILRKTGKVNRKTAVESGPQDGTLGAIRKRAKTVLDQFWSIIQGMGFSVIKKTQEFKSSLTFYIYIHFAKKKLFIVHNLGNGEFKIWAWIGTELHQMNVTVPRIFYVNRRS